MGRPGPLPGTCAASGDEARPRHVPLLPADAPLLSLADAAAYLRRTPGAVRKLLDGRADSDDGEVGQVLRRWVVRLSPHRTYIAREPFLAWLRTKAQSPRENH